MGKWYASRSDYRLDADRNGMDLIKETDDRGGEA
jgi:hypothetical protein